VNDALPPLTVQIIRLQQEFPAFAFRPHQTWGGVSIAAIRCDGQEGLHTLVTADPNEMRAELAELPTWTPSGSQ
jgi:hypothetical protein